MENRTGLIATKIGSSSYFSEDGNVIPVTLLKVDECIVSNIKTLEKDGYSSLQVISIDGVTDLKKVKKPHFSYYVFNIGLFHWTVYVYS